LKTKMIHLMAGRRPGHPEQIALKRNWMRGSSPRMRERKE
jgi:hypothetical protein